MSTKKIITKKQIDQIVKNNESGVRFANKGLNKRLEKNKKVVERSLMLRENIRKKEAKKQQKEMGAVMPRPDIKPVADLSKETDENLLSAAIGLGLTAADMIDGGVDAVRALSIVKKADKVIQERANLRRLAMAGASGIVVNPPANEPRVVHVDSNGKSN